MATQATIESIQILRAGETPWSYAHSPGQLPGPWGTSAEEAIATYERQTGDRVQEHWIRGSALWVVTDHGTEG